MFHQKLFDIFRWLQFKNPGNVSLITIITKHTNDIQAVGEGDLRSTWRGLRKDDIFTGKKNKICPGFNRLFTDYEVIICPTDYFR